MPFYPDPPELGDSYDTAVRRFLSLENKFRKQPTFQPEYKQFIQEYESLGHLEYVLDDEINHIPLNSLYYLCHHPVFKLDSTTHTLRVVFDGSCKTSNGKSLNDNLLVGQPLQQELFCILLRFRLYQYVSSTDTTKMYRQVLIHPEHCNYQLILW